MTKLSRSLLSGASVFALSMTGGTPLGGVNEAQAAAECTVPPATMTTTNSTQFFACGTTTLSGVSVVSGTFAGDLHLLTNTLGTSGSVTTHGAELPGFGGLLDFVGLRADTLALGIFIDSDVSITGQLINDGVVDITGWGEAGIANTMVNEALVGIGSLGAPIGGGIVNNGSVNVGAVNANQGVEFVTAIGVGVVDGYGPVSTSFFNATGADVKVAASVTDSNVADLGSANAIGVIQGLFVGPTLSANITNHGLVSVLANFTGSFTVGGFEAGIADAAGLQQFLALGDHAHGNVLNGGGTLNVTAYAYEQVTGSGDDVFASANGVGIEQDIFVAVEGALAASNDGEINVGAEGIAIAANGRAHAVAEGIGVEQDIFIVDSGVAFFTNNQVTGSTTSTGELNVVASAVAVGETAWADANAAGVEQDIIADGDYAVAIANNASGALINVSAIANAEGYGGTDVTADDARADAEAYGIEQDVINYGTDGGDIGRAMASNSGTINVLASANAFQSGTSLDASASAMAYGIEQDVIASDAAATATNCKAPSYGPCHDRVSGTGGRMLSA